ncbi:MAG: GNAT family N-acetyltransferase [Oscillospiraceae bacterium]|nr:GNAT family N-acetyltransferase [Oscillospiraceae bacterium]
MLTDISEHAIRNFALGDMELVVEFFDQMGGESRAFFNRGDGNKQNALEFFRKNGDEPNAIRFLSTANDESGKETMTGYVFAWDMNSKLPTLGIAVRDEYKGKGLGRRLIKHLVDYLQENDYGGVMLTTSFANIRGQSLYTRMGFEHIGTHTSGELLYILRFKK